ncbi:MAG: hypothetical protein WAJ86_12425, partial [Candidatus Acidiferrales bacterium]
TIQGVGELGEGARFAARFPLVDRARGVELAALAASTDWFGTRNHARKNALIEEILRLRWPAHGRITEIAEAKHGGKDDSTGLRFLTPIRTPLLRCEPMARLERPRHRKRTKRGAARLPVLHF